MKQKPETQEGMAELELWASTPFEAYTTENLAKPPSNEFVANPFAVTLRLSYAALLMSKEDLVANWQKAVEEDEGDLLMNLADTCREMKEFAEWAAQLCEQCQLRMLIVAAAVSQAEERAA